jgi:hypothetical protein
MYVDCNLKILFYLWNVFIRENIWYSRWCHVRFSSEELARSALKELSNKEVKWGKLIVKQTKKYEMNNCENKSKKTPQLYK